MTNNITITLCRKFTQPAPVSADIRAVASTLVALGGRVDEESWMILRRAVENLSASAVQVECFERFFTMPSGGEA